MCVCYVDAINEALTYAIHAVKERDLEQDTRKHGACVTERLADDGTRACGDRHTDDLGDEVAPVQVIFERDARQNGLDLRHTGAFSINQSINQSRVRLGDCE